MNNDYNTVLATGLYTEPVKMCRKNTSYEKKWAEINKLFAKEYYNIRKLQHINVTQAGFYGSNMVITM